MAVPPCPMRGPGAARDAETLLRHRARAAVQAPEVEPETDATLGRASAPVASRWAGYRVCGRFRDRNGRARPYPRCDRSRDPRDGAHWPVPLAGLRVGLAVRPGRPGAGPDRLRDACAGSMPMSRPRAGRVVLCQTHMIGHRIDGLPDFRADRVEVLAGPQLRARGPAERHGAAPAVRARDRTSLFPVTSAGKRSETCRPQGGTRRDRIVSSSAASSLTTRR